MAGDAIRVWLYLQRVEAYEAAWRAHGGVPAGFEPGPFPIRIQTAADREAARFDLLARADPHEAGGPASPFRAQPEMVEAVLEPDVEPLVPLVAAGVFDPPIGLTSLQLRDGSAEDGGSLELSFEARRRESAIDGTPPVHEVGLRLTARR